MNTFEHQMIIADSLNNLGFTSPIIDFEVLAGGVSGSHTYRIQSEGQDVILKVTLATSEPFQLERAQREFHFYNTFSDTFPVQIPKCLGSFSGKFGVCLLLSTYSKVIQQAQFQEIAKQLAAVHAHFWRISEDESPDSWLQVTPIQISNDALHKAQTTWAALYAQPRLQAIFTQTSFETIHLQLDKIPALIQIIERYPPSLCHGDCHLDNLLSDVNGELVWADWQECKIGRGPEDLSFLFQRAAHAGIQLPTAQMIAAYQNQLVQLTGEDISIANIERVMNASELRTILLEWPFYLGQASIEQIGDLLQKIEWLVSEVWE